MTLLEKKVPSYQRTALPAGGANRYGGGRGGGAATRASGGGLRPSSAHHRCLGLRKQLVKKTDL